MIFDTNADTDLFWAVRAGVGAMATTGATDGAQALVLVCRARYVMVMEAVLTVGDGVGVKVVVVVVVITQAAALTTHQPLWR